MLLKWLIFHQWKEMTRSTFWQKNVAMNIIIGFFLFLMFLNILVLGLLIDKILEEVFPDADPVAIFNGGLLFFLMADLFVRYMMQPLPTFSPEAYLHLPVPRNRMVFFVINKSIFSVLNYLPLFIFVPFAAKVVAPYEGQGAMWAWLAGMIMMILANNFFATYLKRQLTSRPSITGIFALVLIIVVLLDRFDFLSVTSASSAFFGAFIHGPLILVIPLLWLFITYMLNFYLLKGKLYPDELVKRKVVRMDRLTSVRYFEFLGLTGDIITLEMKLWWRHKRTRSMLYLLPIFLFYGLFFYPVEEYHEQSGFLIFVGVFMSGGLMINYLNYAFGYESNYFDTILTKEIDMKKYIRAKWLIGVIACVVCYLLIIPYVFFGWKILAINTATFLFNIGFLSYILLYLATYNAKKMDLSRGASFNYQGMSANNWLVMIPAFLLPVIIFAPFAYWGNEMAGIIAIALLGLLGLIFSRSLNDKIFQNFSNRKYKMAEGFRK